MTSQPAPTSHLADLRGARYGEIVLITSQEGQLTAAVYNTTGPPRSMAVARPG